MYMICISQIPVFLCMFGLILMIQIVTLKNIGFPETEHTRLPLTSVNQYLEVNVLLKTQHSPFSFF